MTSSLVPTLSILRNARLFRSFFLHLNPNPNIPFRLHSSLTISMTSSWTCSKCTFLNPSSQKSTCQICLSPSASFSPSSSPTPPSSSSSKWSCKACTFLNAFDLSNCEICGTRPSAIDDEEIGDSVGSVLSPLQRCKRKSQEIEGSSDLEISCDEKSTQKSTLASGGSVSDSALATLKILSYNVWFREDLEMHKRMKALGDLIQRHSPDLICFQEVTSNIYGIFQQSDWWKVYNCSVSNEMEAARPYFCMQLSKLPVKSFSRKPFSNSIMGRELCVADINIGSNKKFLLATAHLESPCPGPPTWDQMFSKERVTQAKEALNLLKDSPNVIFGGDMNWDEKQDGAFPLCDGWLDAWGVLRPAENGWTYDTKANPMLTGNRTLQKRLDRFVCRLEDFRVSHIEMIGMEAIQGVSYIKQKKVRKEVRNLELPVLPSDHYGLLLTICACTIKEEQKVSST